MALQEVVTRRQFLRGAGIGAAGLAGAALLGCNSADSPKPTRTEQSSPLSNKTPEQNNLSEIETQARLNAFQHFLYFIHSSRSFKIDYDFQDLDSNFFSSITDPKIKVTQTNDGLVNIDPANYPINDILKGKISSNGSDLLAIKWQLDIKARDGRRSINSGKGEIKSFNVSSQSLPISEADKANGTQWQGKVNIKYIDRWSTLIPHFGGNSLRFFGKPEEWNEIDVFKLDRVAKDMQFSPWEDNSMTIPLRLQNGKWAASLATFSNDPQARTKGVSIPYPIAQSFVGPAVTLYSFSVSGPGVCNINGQPFQGCYSPSGESLK